MIAEIVSIGTEILLGHVVNTNASYLSQKLAGIGIDVFYHTTVGDNPKRLFEAIEEARGRSDIVITSGGLGPTVDDITAATITKLAGRKPKWIRNRVGSAPGLIAEYKDKAIICLPGPPRELVPMFEHSVIPYLKNSIKVSGCQSVIESRTIRTTGLTEAKVNAMVKDLLELKPPTTVGIYAKLGEVDLKIMAKAANEKKAKFAIDKIERKIRARLKSYIFGYDDETLEAAVGNILLKKRKTLAIAESCTGGLVSNRVTNISGSSKYFIAGFVSYSNESKVGTLGVSKVSLKRYGAVSKEVALEMAKGMKYLVCADIGLGITGIAGPAGGTRKKPVGLVYIALAGDRKRIVKECRFRGSREEIKFQASQAVLNLLKNNV